MRKIPGILLPVLLLLLLSGCTGHAIPQKTRQEPVRADMEKILNSPLWTDESSAHIILLSDLHYTAAGARGTSDVTGISFSEEITDAIVQEVIDAHPDALVMTGDSTNSGNKKDAAALAAKLEKIRDAGVQIIMTTGNHDFDGMSPKEFEETYFGLLEPVVRDPASLSYTAAVKDLIFLAMDDGAVHPGGLGEFSGETMGWISAMLDTYRDKKVIFLCHHSILYGSREGRGSSNMVQNEDLADLLRSGGVRLAATGHMHYQWITQEDGLWEIISAMPFSGRHLMGFLAADSHGAVYRAEPLDLSKYAPGLSGELDREERAASAARRKVFSEILEKEKVKRPESDKVLDLIMRFFLYFEEGTIADHAKELVSDPAYTKMIEVLWDYNYGPWIKSAVENTGCSSVCLEVDW